MSSPVSLSNFVFFGWGATTGIAVSGTQQRCAVTLTAGAGAIQQPSITFTFPVPYYVAPLSIAQMTNGTGVISDVPMQTNPTNAIFTYDSQPIAGKSYIFTFDTLGM